MSFSHSYDATKEDTIGPVLGRLVNHGKKDKVNAKMRLINVGSVPTLCLFALRDIEPGKEVLYDYGEKNYPWV